MTIIGSEKEIQWVQSTLLNNCVKCPYMAVCNQKAMEEATHSGDVKMTCEEYLIKNIVFVTENNNI